MTSANEKRLFAFRKVFLQVAQTLMKHEVREALKLKSRL